MIRHTFLFCWLPHCVLTAGLSAIATGLAAQEAPALVANAATPGITLALVLQSAARNLGVQQAQRSLEASRADVLSANHAPFHTNLAGNSNSRFWATCAASVDSKGSCG